MPSERYSSKSCARSPVSSSTDEGLRLLDLEDAAVLEVGEQRPLELLGRVAGRAGQAVVALEVGEGQLEQRHLPAGELEHDAGGGRRRGRRLGGRRRRLSGGERAPVSAASGEATASREQRRHEQGESDWTAHIDLADWAVRAGIGRSA